MRRGAGLWRVAGFLLVCLLIYLLLFNNISFKRASAPQKIVNTAEIAQWQTNRRRLNVTPLGEWLLAPEDTPPPPIVSNRSKPYLILVWENGPFLERRHLRRFSRDKQYSPWEGCTVYNCRLTYESEDLDSADAVLFHLHRTKSASSLPPRPAIPSQRWVFLSDEAPPNTFLSRNQRLADYDGLFNWSMTYRMDSDVPVPYGRTVLAKRAAMTTDQLEAFLRGKSKHKLAAILGSNCSGSNGRWQYVQRLKQILGDELEILGHCLGGNSTACPGHFDVDCPALAGYRFYLSFENSDCREYLSEKVFWQAYGKGSVPVLMGTDRPTAELLLPPDSFLHVDDFPGGPDHLAEKLLRLDPREYAALHRWRLTHAVINEHGYFASPSVHYCRLCQALNYNPTGPKVYEDLARFWSVEKDCAKTRLL